MTLVHIECPACGFSKSVPRESLPEKARTARCPKCGQSFELFRGEEEFSARPNTPEEWQQWQEFSQQQSTRQDADESGVAPLPLGELFAKSYAHYRPRAFGLALLVLVGALAGSLPWLLLLLDPGHFGLSGDLPLFKPALGLGAALVSLFASSCCLAVMVFYIADEVPLRLAVTGARPYCMKVLRLHLLLGFMLVGGLSLFLLPGLLFLALFPFAFFVLVVERETGVSALLVSSQYVMTRPFDTGLKLLVLFLAVGLLSAIPVIGGLVATPFGLVGLYVVYEDVRAQRGFQRSFPGWRSRFALLAVACLGFLLLWVPAVMLYFNLFEVRELVPQSVRSQAYAFCMSAGQETGLVRPGGGILLERRVFDPGEELQVRVLYSKGMLEQVFVACSGRDGVQRVRSSVETSNAGFTTVKMQAPRLKGEYELKVFEDEALEKMISHASIVVQ